MFKLKKKPYLLFILLFIYSLFYAEGLDQLTNKISNSISSYFSDKYNVKAAVIKFDNHSGISDLAAYKFYQLLVSKLEGNKKIHFNDLIINISKRAGIFNLNRINNLNYLIYIKLIKNRNKIGAGTVIFSKTVDKIVFIKYFEDTFPTGEKDLLNIRDYGFRSSGFSKIIEMDVDLHLMDFRTIKDPKGEIKYLFFYPQKIELFKITGNNFEKSFSIKLQWQRPYYPVKEYEGKLSYFYWNKVLYVTAGGNFSSYAKVFSFSNSQWKEIDRVKFVPFRFIQLNRNHYLAGASYKEGKNYFKSKIFLYPFNSDRIIKEKYYEKKVNEFYALDFSAKAENLDSIHIIDKDYNYRFLAADFEERTTEKNKRGASLCTMNGEWLAISDYSRSNDKLYFYRIEDGNLRLVYENKIIGEIVFISDGVWKSMDGFWIYIKITEKKGEDFKLQFWSKKNV